MKISATAKNKKVDVNARCGKLELRAQYPGEDELLALLYKYLLAGDLHTLLYWLDDKVEGIRRFEKSARFKPEQAREQAEQPK